MLDAPISVMNMLFRLVNKQRGQLKQRVNELSAKGTLYKSEDEILSAWREYFGALATPTDYQDSDEE